MYNTKSIVASTTQCFMYPLVTFQVHLPENAVQLGSLLCQPAESSVWGRTQASRRRYPTKI